MFLKILLILKKSLKWHQKAPQMAPKSTPMAPKGPPRPPQTRPENKHETKTPKTPKNKPVLASEREARSRLDHCRKKCFTTVGHTAQAATGATGMVIFCLHVQATPVVFGRAWRRGLDHVYRVIRNIRKHNKKQQSKTNYLQALLKNTNWGHYNLHQMHYILYKYWTLNASETCLKHIPKCPEMALFGRLGATLEPWCHQSP